MHLIAEAERLLQSNLLPAIGEALVASDVLGNINYWNEPARDLYGWSAAEAIGRNVFGTIFTDELCDFSSFILQEIKEGRRWGGDYEGRRKDGSPMSIRLSLAPIRSSEGHLVGSMCLAHDISHRRDLEKAVRASNERFEIVANATNDIVWDWDLSSDTVWWNENLVSLLGHERLNFNTGSSRNGFITPDDRARVTSGISQALSSDASAWQDEYRARRGDGSCVTILDRGFILRNKEGTAIRMTGAMMDISARKEAELASNVYAMQQSLLAQFGQKVLANSDLTSIMDEATVVVTEGLATKFSRVLKLTADGESFVLKAGRGWDEHCSGYRIPIVKSKPGEGYALQLSSPTPIVVDDFHVDTRFVASEILTAHGIASAVEVAIRGSDGAYGILGAYSCERHAFSATHVSLLSTIATTLGTAVERVASDEKVAHAAQFDALTGLPNRNLFHDRIEQTLTQARRNNWRVGVLYIDLDRFKAVNDTYGHGVGDTLLMLVSNRLGKCVRSGDTVGRLGGDEFAIVISNLSTPDDASLVAKKILEEFSRPFKLDGHETYVTASIGISIYPDDGDNSVILLKNADTSMYRAKEQGRNNVQFFTQELNARVTHRLNVERELRHALERNELELHYQPQVSLDTGRIVSAEALLRWHHPQRGLLAPADFIAIAEESGLIVPIGQWVVDKACAQATTWHRGGHRGLTIAVNISPTEIRRGNLPEQIQTALGRAGLDPGKLEVEITESMAMESAESFIDTLRALKEVGVNIAIDDFGTGYSNLRYLKRFPIDTIKVDQIFVRDIVTDTDDAAIIRAIIAMAHQLKLKVVAEGVETEAQASFLRRNHIDLVQGFLFAAPLAATSFGRLLDTHMAQPLLTKSDSSLRALLLVDDEENILHSLRRALRNEGYTIHTAKSARDALDVLARTPIGVIVSDERMPEITGTEFLKRVSALYPNTIRIMLSGYTDLAVVTRAVNEGSIYRFLTKPWEDDALREDIREAFRRWENGLGEGLGWSSSKAHL
jgi:diguanylate cyclase (GGDEF)-like protein/PAS domain S-box-containing protein